MLIPIHTANTKFNFDKEFCINQITYRLDDLIFMTHKELSLKLKWKYFPLKRGTFGYDSIAVSIGHLLLASPAIHIDLEKAAKCVHDGWIVNYKWWTCIKPYILLPNIYTKPTKSLNDKRRNILANTPYEKLPESEKETNKIIAKYLLEILFKVKILYNNCDFKSSSAVITFVD